MKSPYSLLSGNEKDLDAIWPARTAESKKVSERRETLFYRLFVFLFPWPEAYG
jgi:hypothetical protein